MYTVNGNSYQYRRGLQANTTGLGDLANQPLPFVGPDLTGKVLASLNDAVLTGPDGATLIRWWWESEVAASPVGHAQFDLTGGRSAYTAAYLYYNATDGDPGDQSDQSGVWPASHKAVYHCADAASPLLDSTTSGANLTGHNAPTYAQTGAIGNCVGMSRNRKDWFSTVDTDLNTGLVTLAAWVRCGVVDGTWENIIARDNTNTGTVLLWRTQTGVRWSIRLNGSEATLRTVASPSAPLAGTWEHWVGTYDGAVSRLYRNGVAVGTPLSIAGALDTDGYTKFRFSQSSGDAFGGSLDDVRVLSTALTADEVAALYRAGAGTLWTWGAEETAPSSLSPRLMTGGALSLGGLRTGGNL